MARAYFDESGDEYLPGYFGVAGFVGSEAKWSVLEEIWAETLRETGAPYLHMREFAHSTGAFGEGWKGDKSRREALIAGIVRAVLESHLTAIGAALRTEDFAALPAPAKALMVSPYFVCLQDVLYGFALMARAESPVTPVEVTGDRKEEYAVVARQMYAVCRYKPRHQTLAGELRFADMRETIGLQAADLLAYEMTKELKNQDSRPTDQLRWPLDRILREPETSEGKMLKFITAEALDVKARDAWDEEGQDLMSKQMDEALRVLRGRSGPFKERLRNYKGAPV